MNESEAHANYDDLNKKKIAGCWDEWSAAYDWGRFLDRDLINKESATWKGFFSKELGEKRLRILDVGTGTGFLSVPLAEMGHDVVGVDMSDGMISRCRSKAEGSGVRIDLRKGDAEALPFDGGSFDVVVSRWVLWTLLYPDRAISEWHRVVRPGGRAYAFETPFVGKKAGSCDKIKKNISTLMVSIIEQRNAWSEKYDTEIDKTLPLHYNKPGSYEQQVKLFGDCGFSDVATSRMDEASSISDEKWRKMPWRYRLGGKWDESWYYIRGYKY